MTGATLCSGIAAPETAKRNIDWRWCAEIEPFPSAVLAERFGHPNLGGMTAPDFIDRALAYGPIDLLVAGTPCQSFSVAGLRGGLNDSRGNLTLRFVEIADAINPRFLLWENVPGVLSDATNAFGYLLGALAGHDTALVPGRGQRWTNAGLVDGPRRRVAWRVQDAQYHGLAQRRERVFVVACPRNGADPAEVLFEREGVQRHSAPRREAGESATAGVGSGFTPSSHGCYREGIGTLRRNGGDLGGGSEALIPAVSMCLNGGAMRRIDGESETFIAATLDTSYGRLANLRAASGGSSRSYAATAMAVRRLTPVECARLQGFPDNHTAIHYRGKLAADGPQYKAYGNSMAVPVIRWIIDRIEAQA